MKKNIISMSSLFFCALILTGCAEPNAGREPVTQVMAAQPPESYRIGIGDELELKFFSAPELNDRQIVAPDGTISMMFAPHTRAAGLTLAQLTRRLQRRLSDHVKQLDMDIIIRNFTSEKAYVIGEVAKSGPVQLTGSETLLQVLSDAGGLTPAAGMDKVALVRHGDANVEKVYAVNVNKLMNGADMSQDVRVQAGDLILVPPSDAVLADRWMDQHVRQILPLSTTAGIDYTISNNGATTVRP